MFERPHHQLIANILLSLNADTLRDNHCYFGGGTAIALHNREFRESVDLGFLVSDRSGYRQLRQLMNEGFAAILHEDAPSIVPSRQIRADQYGIRTTLPMGSQLLKFEIVLEGRIDFEEPHANNRLCGVTTLTTLDLAASKLLANSDRWADASVFSRDLIDLAMIVPSLHLLRQAINKSRQAYGESVIRDLLAAIDAMQSRREWLDRCIHALSMTVPKALLWQKIRALKRMATTA